MSLPTDGRAAGLMKNFLRALRYVWPYRRRLIISCICAVIAAGLWGANFLAIYPVLKILANDQTPQVWVENSVRDLRKDIEKREVELKALDGKEQEVNAIPDAREREKQERGLAN